MDNLIELKASVRSVGTCVIATCHSCEEHGFGDDEFEAVLRLKMNINRRFGWIFPMDNDNL